jgi:hypothetical protein
VWLIRGDYPFSMVLCRQILSFIPSSWKLRDEYKIDKTHRTTGGILQAKLNAWKESCSIYPIEQLSS